MNGKTFEQLSARSSTAPVGSSPYWPVPECPRLADDACGIPQNYWPEPGPLPPVYEPATALMLAAGLIAIHLWRRV